VKKRFVFITTEHKGSKDACERCFQRYGIELKFLTEMSIEEIHQAFKEQTPDNVILAYLSIETEYKTRDNKELSWPVCPLTLLKQVTVLTAYTFSDGKIVKNVVEKCVEGYVKHFMTCDPIDGWDRAFVSKTTLNSVEDLKQNGINIEATYQLVSDFITQHIYYSKPINLRYEPLDRTRSIDFNEVPADFVVNDPLYSNPWSKKYGCYRVFLEALNCGLFFRSAKNRREKNYWLPGLNAGLPLTPKRDLIHERCYMAHDFGHFTIPDLICVGNHNTRFKHVYIAYRMMSEAFTQVMTDMVFVDTIKRSGIEYDYSKRKIYPLFSDLEIDMS